MTDDVLITRRILRRQLILQGLLCRLALRLLSRFGLGIGLAFGLCVRLGFRVRFGLSLGIGLAFGLCVRLGFRVRFGLSLGIRFSLRFRSFLTLGFGVCRALFFEFFLLGLFQFFLLQLFLFSLRLFFLL